MSTAILCGLCMTTGAVAGFFLACLGVAAGLKDKVYIERDRIPGRAAYSEDMETNNGNMYALGWNDYRNKLLGLPEEDVSTLSWYEGD